MDAGLNQKTKNVRDIRSDLVFNIVLYSLAAIMLVIIIYPLYFIIIASFSDPSAVTNGRVWFWPGGFTLEGYQAVFEHERLWIGYRNTIVYTLMGTLIGLVINIPAAYVLSRKDLVFRKFLTFMFLFVMFFSGGLIPTYLTVRDFGLDNTWLVMVLPFSVSIYNVIVARTFFQTSLPADLWDAAQIDGCGNLRFFFTVAVPLSKAVIAVIALWTAVYHWNSYFNALIYLRDENLQPLQLILRNILITNQMQSGLGTGEAAALMMRRANLMRYSSIIISTVPIMCFYPFVQKHFNQGVMIGAIKG
ncbi:MAG: carbohydrate ABC transporter permease [Clostridiales bacterium]|jgi:putative aldouronate transport system permease protein|nr:carbohydrate ABC transporter permease [Clostridiales bacterium]